MQKNNFFTMLAVLMLSLFFQNANAQSIANYDDLILSPDTFWNGSDNSGGFTNAGFYFQNSYTSFGGNAYAWFGFAYSNRTDTTTIGYTNQFSAICGKGSQNSANYAVSYVNYDWTNNYAMQPNVIRFATPKTISGFYATNNTYAYFSMLNGDGTLSKKFGGLSGNDPDWLKLEVKGYSNGSVIDTVNFFLADFRFPINTQDYIVKTWKWIDLSSLGAVDSLAFGLTSSDQGAYGMNTPAYFCLDNFNGLNPNVTVNDKNNSNFKLSISPNPFSESILIQCNNTKDVLIMEIFDINGRVVFKTEHLMQEQTIRLADFPSGVYVVKISGPDFNQYEKIIKQ